MKIYLYALMIVVLSSLALAYPQVIFSSYNLTIDATSENITYRITSEGSEASETISMHIDNNTNFEEWTFHYGRQDVPLTFSRDICEDTDVAVLINALANTNNISSYWMECLDEKQNCTSELGICRVDTGYKENYTEAVNKITDLKVTSASKESDSAIKQKEIDNLKSQRLLLIAGIIAAGGFAYTSWRKVTPKTLNSPGLNQLPRFQRT